VSVVQRSLGPYVAGEDRLYQFSIAQGSRDSCCAAFTLPYHRHRLARAGCSDSDLPNVNGREVWQGECRGPPRLLRRSSTPPGTGPHRPGCPITATLGCLAAPGRSWPRKKRRSHRTRPARQRPSASRSWRLEPASVRHPQMARPLPAPWVQRPVP
jgi:hypothetical protein